ncbi:SARP family transcriptional regulator [Virgisporangium aliadipatigenens]|uniref:SARP family transcriptional regulator n=1 Tax=Virgisporangium aliadipatigenens TaxID=741659 RepID=A0A8J4DSS9_9ACTN|nr:BTAD domain-containing putative transcriptional regulator [Virgisporangium aliadipatigenens]GIJ47547.1 SARP family transcriptional regulator [Virgisporangium aliadipatigenens]
MPIRIRALGRLELAGHEGDQVPLGPPKQRLLLGVLVCRPGELHTVAELTEALWGDAPPASARNNLRSYIHGLRQALGVAAVEGNGRPGYRLALDPAEIDIGRFDGLARDGEAALHGGDLRAAREAFRAALSLWRDRPFADLDDDCPPLVREASRLEERRLVVIEQRIDADLADHRAADLVAELTGLVTRHPYRERFVAQLMLALYRAGRQAEALAAYRRAQVVLDEELGIEPGGALRELHHQILTRDPQLDPPAAHAAAQPAVRPAAPAELPPSSGRFTGRAPELARLDQVATAAARRETTAVIAIVGAAGVGKSALAVEWGRRALARFPDGQLFVHLRGFDHRPALRGYEAVTRCLRSLGVAADAVPDGLEEASALYRSLLADRRVLVVLDDAASAEQVRPLLPGSPGSVVLVTSRFRLPGLVASDGARQLILEPMSDGEAVSLIAAVLDDERIAAEPEAAAELVATCGFLPLALRIAAANLAEFPERPIARHVAELRAATLDGLEVEGDPSLAVRAAFDLSYEALTEPERRTFRLVGLVPGPDFGPDAVAALTGLSSAVAGRQLHRLAGAHLLQRRGDERYGFHDLVGEYARERAFAEDDADAAVSRLFDHYLERADAAATALHRHVLRLPEEARPTFDTVLDGATAWAWMTTELPNVVAACEQAAVQGPFAVAWLLADALRGHLTRVRDVVALDSVAAAATHAAAAAGDPLARASAALCAASRAQFTGSYPEALLRFDELLALSRVAGWRRAEATALSNLAVVQAEMGDNRKAIESHRAALEVHRAIGWTDGEAITLTNLGFGLLRVGRPAESVDVFGQALRLSRAVGSSDEEIEVLGYLGHLRVGLGQHELAREHLAESRRIGHLRGRVHVEADVHIEMSALAVETGDPAAARDHAMAALALLGPANDPWLVYNAHRAAAAAHAAAGDHRLALEHVRAAHLQTERVYGSFVRIQTALELALAEFRVDNSAAARAEPVVRTALDDARRTEHRILEADAHLALAEILLGRDDPAEAAEQFAAAVAIYTETGWRLGRATVERLAAEIPTRA